MEDYSLYPILAGVYWASKGDFGRLSSVMSHQPEMRFWQII